MPAWKHFGVILTPNTVGPSVQTSRAVEGRRFTLVRHQVTLRSRCVKLEFEGFFVAKRPYWGVEPCVGISSAAVTTTRIPPASPALP